MKKIIFGFSALCLIAFTSCKDDAASKIKDETTSSTEGVASNVSPEDLPVISFTPAEFDFGKIKSGTPVETEFKYNNVGKSPLVVSDIKSSCGCTVPTGWSKDPIAPGESGSFKVNFNGQGANQITKTVTLTTNTANGSETVKIKAFIEGGEAAAVPKTGGAAATNATPMLQKPAATKTSTQPGHEGHNHN